MKNDSTSRPAVLRVVRPLVWPARTPRTPAHKRRDSSQPTYDHTLRELGNWVDYLQIGRAELTLGDGDDPGASIRFVWRGQSCIACSDVNNKLYANAFALRSYLETIYTLSLHRQSAMLEVVLRRLRDEPARPPAPVPQDFSRVSDATDLLVSLVGDAVAEAAVHLFRGERSGSETLKIAGLRATWTATKGGVRIQVDSHAESPQTLGMVQTALELEPWIDRAETHVTRDGSRVVLITSKRQLASAGARAWLRANTCLRERRPAVRRWLEEGA